MTIRRFAVASLAIVAGAALGGAAIRDDTATGNGVACATRRAPVVVNLDNRRHAHVLDHAWDAIRDGHPLILHIDRAGADANRAASLRGWPTRRGYDRDEYPPAVAAEGGAGADVRYVRSSENRSAGAVMRNELAAYCDGQRFRFEKRTRPIRRIRHGQ